MAQYRAGGDKRGRTQTSTPHRENQHDGGSALRRVWGLPGVAGGRHHPNKLPNSE